MILVLTSITLKSPLKFFSLSYKAMRIIQQMQDSSCIAFQKRGFWTTHYTMTLWRNIEDMKRFSGNGAHLAAIKSASLIATEVRTLTLEADELPKWREAGLLLKEKGKTLRYE
ncbi:hypothetical protein [Maribacter sp. HTCC2170]|uniref:hypothetical protein n=1 Tax=Maribacter sp. (strain HTCC2170 / KCCM 42371) TaxID=313603 RepID=UPI00006AE610|nr:hypothetical protein [Maribacter sp. HTCC2170]EAR00556.1 hypothetical protein FB2170_08624 [Maribacter sp. HTCC2170]